MTIREMILRELATTRILTNTELSHLVGKKPSLISSATHKMYKAGKLIRYEDVGPRGGYGYAIWSSRW